MYTSYIRSLATCLLLLLISSCSTISIPVPTTSSDRSEQEIMALALQIHDNTLVLDAHADIVTPSTAVNFLSTDGLSKVHASKLRSGGVGAVVMSVAVPPGPRTVEGDDKARVEANEKLSSVLALAAEDDGAVIARSSVEIRDAFEAGKISYILGFQNARSLQRDISAIDSFYHAGIRIFGLNHLGHNDFSDSSRPSFDGETGKYEPASEHGGVSDLGRDAIKAFNRLGAIIDVSQMSRAATIQTIALSTSPIIASHSNVLAISNVSRNISDEEIDLIAMNGGVIHVSPFRAYLLSYTDPSLVERIKAARRDAGVSEEYSYPFELYWEIKDPSEKYAFLMAISDIIGPADVNDLIDHIDYIVNRVGIDHVGIGSDFNHGSAIDGYVDAADALNVTIGLVRRGYKEADIKKIWSGNFLRVFSEVERKAIRNN